MVWNRTDGTLASRLSDFELRVVNGGGTELFFFQAGDMSGVERLAIPLPVGLHGDRVRIDLPGSSRILSLAEVQIFGAPIPEPSGAVLLGIGPAGLLRRRRKHG